MAYTRDAGGRRLPAHGAVWLFVGSTDLNRPGASEFPVQQIRSELLRKGYFLWPDDAARLAD